MVWNSRFSGSASVKTFIEGVNFEIDLRTLR
jgi:hypothetical protein